jgi:hyperosmotically inducible protein
MKQWMAITGLAVAIVAASAPAYAQQDAWVTMKTKIALITADDVSASDLNVDTVNGAVTLHGTVETPTEKSRAETIARGIDGVKSVQNLLQVVPDSSKKVVEAADAEVKTRVDAAFAAQAALKDSGISVASVNRGVVLLKGRARTLEAHLLAIETARGVSGVRRVATQVDVATSM